MSEHGEAVQSLLDAFEGIETPNHGTNDPLHCDYCSEVIKPNREVRAYVSDTELTGMVPMESFGLQRVYGPCCDRQRVQWPCEGATELLLACRYTTQQTLVNWSVVDHSSASDGEPWDPVEVYNAISPVDYHEHQKAHIMADGHVMPQGPEDIVDHLMLVDIDIRDVVDEDGNVDVSEEQVKEYHENMREKSQELIEDM